MAINYLESVSRVASHNDIIFAGDHVRLAGQIDYPLTTAPADGYPLMVILHHAGGNVRHDYTHYAQLALDSGYAVFRWDKRGAGRSGASGRGSAAKDAVNAYQIALEQPQINPNKAVILAQGDGTLLLGESFSRFEAVQQPFAALLIGSLLDPQRILAIETRVQVIIGADDWISWQAYGKEACDAHNAVHPYGARFCVAHHADRTLIDRRLKGEHVHIGAKQIIKDWLRQLDEL